MEIWAQWTDLLANGISFFSMSLGVGEGLAIILLTLVVRAVLFPISYRVSYQGYKNKLAMQYLKPELDTIKEQYKNRPNEMMQLTMALYKKHNVKFFSRINWINTLLQGVFGFGSYRAIQKSVVSSKFLWVDNLLKPDLFVAILVGVLTFVSMYLMPGMNEQNAVWMCAVMAIGLMFMMVTFPSALGLYWGTSNCVTIAQQLILKRVISREGIRMEC